MNTQSFDFEYMLVTPRINLNGNTADDLISQIRAVLDAFRVLEEAVAAAAANLCHGRNFQTTTHPDASTYAAQDAMRERRVALDRMRAEWLSMATAIQAQKHAR